jgi:phosphatidylserine/phosphatidylglycerophosphate/cardiolipin synthase-like enzyme
VRIRARRSSNEARQQLRKGVPTVVSVNVMHQKIVVIDEHTVLLGSLNSLSQSRSREVMLTFKGGYFDRKGIESSARLGRHRWTVERTVSWLSGIRRLHRRYERTSDHFLASVGIAAALIC